MPARPYLILSTKHSPGWDAAAVWWGPEENGYYSALEAAGRYTEEEAQKICRLSPGDTLAVLEMDAMKLAHLVVEYGGRVKSLAKIGGGR